ncbi:hypothetical protein LR48_Vigan02g053200 [Vigna angularis]|uniref:Uncharacterized protein n=1 Tax=Phaseolus angularis TaxID=3914 RepID=A0A0L9TVD8_PHAAN|nr:hypothetical protein LR48_Vigan02g053200 [Vigna angularis]
MRRCCRCVRGWCHGMGKTSSWRGRLIHGLCDEVTFVVIRQLATNYTTSRGGTLQHQPSSSTSTTYETIERLTQLLQQHDQENHDLREEYSDLRNEFTNFKSLVMRAFPSASDIPFTVPPTQPRPSSSPAVPQQPTLVQPTSDQPTSVLPSTKQQDDQDHSDDDYVDY